MTGPTHGLELKNIVKRFGDVTVVQELNLTIAQGEFLVLLGESGCGKSTTLRMIAGLEDVTQGQIFIDGRDVTNLHPMERDIAMVFQNYALYPHMDVAKNMSFALRLLGTPEPEVKARVQAAAKILNIEHLLTRKPKELSGGQRQRVAIGRAIVREPKVFLFDEPLSNLDAKLRGHMRAEMSVLHRRLGKTTVYVTHDQIEAMTLATRIVIFDAGRIQQVGPPTEVFNRPANLFVAGFIGTPTMNFFTVRCHRDGDCLALHGDGFVWQAPPWLANAKVAHGQEVTLGLRPQNLSTRDEPNHLQIQVEVVEYLGTESQVSGNLVGSQGKVVSAMVPGDAKQRLQTTLDLRFNPEDLHAFDAVTGQSLRV